MRQWVIEYRDDEDSDHWIPVEIVSSEKEAIELAVAMNKEIIGRQYSARPLTDD